MSTSDRPPAVAAGESRFAHPTAAIEAGREILDPVLGAAGFAFAAGVAGSASGGEFATGEYRKADRILRFSYRYALGCVEYQIGAAALDHNAYMRLLGKAEQSEYLRFSRDEPLAGFRALRHDLEQFGGDFLHGSGDEFRRLAVAWSADAWRSRAL